MIDVAKIDYWAASGSGALHRASPLAKAVFLLLVVAAAVTAKKPHPLLIGYAGMLIASRFAGLPWLRMTALSFYAAVFALLYAVSMRGGIQTYAALLLKAITPAFAVLMLIVSTPYPRIFSLLGSVLPEILSAGLLMTYRTLFILLDMMDNFVSAIRLRGGLSPWSLVKNSANISKGIGMLLVRASERSSRLYAVMAVRGYSGRMSESSVEGFSRHDGLPLAVGAAVLCLAVVWR